MSPNAWRLSAMRNAGARSTVATESKRTGASKCERAASAATEIACMGTNATEAIIAASRGTEAQLRNVCDTPRDAAETEPARIATERTSGRTWRLPRPKDRGRLGPNGGPQVRCRIAAPPAALRPSRQAALRLRWKSDAWL